MVGEKCTTALHFILKLKRLWKSEKECNAITRKSGEINLIQKWWWSQVNFNSSGCLFQIQIKKQRCNWNSFQRRKLEANGNTEYGHKEDLYKMKASNTDIDICKIYWTNRNISRNVIRSPEHVWPPPECLLFKLLAECLGELRNSQRISSLRSTLFSDKGSGKISFVHENDEAKSMQTRFEKVLFMHFYSQIAIKRSDQTFPCLENSTFLGFEIANEGLNQSYLEKNDLCVEKEAKQENFSQSTGQFLHNHDSAIILGEVSRNVVKNGYLQNGECNDKTVSLLEYPFVWYLLATAQYLNEFHQMKNLSLLAFDTKRILIAMKNLRLKTIRENNTFTKTIFVTGFFALIPSESNIVYQLSSLRRIFQNYIIKQLAKVCCKENDSLNNACKAEIPFVTKKMDRSKKVNYLKTSTVYKKDEIDRKVLKTLTSTLFLGFTKSKHDKNKTFLNEWHTLEVMSDAFIYPVYRNNLEFSFEQILNGTPYFSSEVMRFEHHRLSTFANFSIKNTPSALLMAKSGWYATGNTNETKTFCCLQTNSVWNKQDDPYFVHKELSPNCAFINRSDLGQVSIQDGTLEGNRPGANVSPISEISNNLQNTHIESYMPDLKSTFKTSNDDCFGLTGTEGENLRQTPSNACNTLASWSIDCPSRLSSARTHRLHMRDTEDSDHGVRKDSDHKFTDITNQDDSDQSKKSRMITKYRTSPPEKVYQEFILPPLVLEDPKHTDYSTIGIRASSFGGFPIGSGKTPKEFAVGGFYYKGFGDHTSCFHCGITLQGWSKDDDVLVEHVRYNPLCAYMRRLKGDNFIKLVMSATQNSECTPSQAEIREDGSRSTFNVTSEDVISKLKEMGFSQNTISSALGKVTINNGQVAIQKVLDAITEDTSSEERNLGEATATQNGSEGNLLDTQDIELGAYKNSTNQTGSVAGGLSHEISRKSVQSSLEFKDQFICKICMDERVGVVFTPCGHIVTCSECARSVRKCPICRETVRDKIRTIIND